MARSRSAVVMAVFGVLGFSAVLACNGIIGLSDFDRVECTGNRCDGSFDAPIVVPPEAGNDGAILNEAGPGTEPVSWARWKMPSYPDSGAPNVPTYAGNTDGTLTDSVTGLIWKKGTEGGDKTYTYEQAKSACPSGFRLPKRIELASLLDYSRKPYVPAAFTDVANVTVWSSSEVRQLPAGTPVTAYWTVNFNTGIVETLEANGNLKASVLCIRSGS